MKAEAISPVILLNPTDNVGVARKAIAKGTDMTTDGGMVTARADVPSGHKIALRAVAPGEPVLKYGQVIGVATVAIAPGDHVHLHNLAMQESHVTHHFAQDARTTPLLPEDQRRSFQGYVRPDGQVGTRNFIGIVTSVNCSATVARAIADHFNRGGGLDGYANVDGVVALTHGTGCAINMRSEGYLYLQRVLAGYARNPNFAGILFIGLGCETNQIDPIVAKFGLEEGPHLRTMTIQNLGGTRKTVEIACDIIREMLPQANAVQRSAQPLAGLKVALQCGGSDGYSGISANPALGHAADLIVQHGGTAVLSETPEIYGAEHLLTRRAATPEVAQKLMDRIAWWREYTQRNGAELNNNPSHGNKLGGLTTILEKSLGAVAKGGSMPLEAVYEYAEIIDKTGFVFMDTPGYDPVAVTGQVAGGCNVIVFTTGRGSVSGFKPAPCIKVATNSQMYEHMSDDMDINCGDIVQGTDTIEAAGKRIFEKILAVASGEHTLSEDYGFGDNEFVPWQIGAVT
ncbi:UxaA family hydrolase [Paracoccus denitrificans]|nr:altronate dehydratase family protein [Paracoccus denitrificans]MBB4626210.1 galactarate dehydratase [Paracoccus denitrificans]MCU7427582.1 altronate dehydratase family protein [Paracoccus denitrificans]QAR29698.1 altronate dehydratase [Paracoccus denitrificans]UPV98525.1 altronate dehydratase family protein [Paracoccus denitrificans]WQO36640.1 altronate dehydratase family protein [Paracoccus denitrificans]